MAAVLKHCKTCGRIFAVDSPRYAAVYCSDACRIQWRRETQRRKMRMQYVPRMPHEIICKKCGKPFLGRWNAGYCPGCLSDGSAYMNKLRGARTVEP